MSGDFRPKPFTTKEKKISKEIPDRVKFVLLVTNPLTWLVIAGTCLYGGFLAYAVALKWLKREFWDEKPRRQAFFTPGFSPTTERVIELADPSPAAQTTAEALAAVRDVAQKASQTFQGTASPPEGHFGHLSHQELLQLARERGIKGANARWARNTLLSKLEVAHV